MCSDSKHSTLPNQLPFLSPRVNVIVERKVQRETEAKGGRVGVKARDLAPKYVGEEKKDAYVTKLKEKGLWSWDEDWPGDEEDSGIQSKTVFCCTHGHMAL